MHLGEYIKKHPWMIAAIIGAIVLLYLLYRRFASGTVSTAAAQPSIVYPASGATGAIPGASGLAPGNVSTTTSTTTIGPTTTTSTSTVDSHNYSDSLSSVYSPTTSSSYSNQQSTVGPVSTVSTQNNPVTTTTTSNTYTNPTFQTGLLPPGFAGVAGVTPSTSTAQNAPIAVPASSAFAGKPASVIPALTATSVPQGPAGVPGSNPLFSGPMNVGLAPAPNYAPGVAYNPKPQTYVSTGGYSPFPGGQY